MKNKVLASGFKMPALGIGTYNLGGEDSPNYSNDEECVRTIRSALRMGFTHIDTAESYGSGHTEELVGKAIKGYDRKKLFITTKVSKSNLKYGSVIKSAKSSIKRMNCAYIDLYLIHASNPEIPIKETVEALNKLVDDDLVKNIGVCNFTIKELEEAQKHSRRKIVVNQMKYCLWTREPPDIRTVGYCQENDIMVTAYKLFGRGRLSTERIPLVQELSKKYGKTEAQIIVSWVVSKKNVIAIFKSMNEKHLKENLEALKFQMDLQDSCRMDRIITGKL